MNRDTARPLPQRTIRTDPPSRWADHLQVALAQNQGNEWSPQSATFGGVAHRMSHQRKVHGSVTGAGNSWGWGGPTIVRRWPVSSAGRTRWTEVQARWPRVRHGGRGSGDRAVVTSGPGVRAPRSIELVRGGGVSSATAATVLRAPPKARSAPSVPSPQRAAGTELSWPIT
jgi:hypothetical protein